MESSLKASQFSLIDTLEKPEEGKDSIEISNVINIRFENQKEFMNGRGI